MSYWVAIELTHLGETEPELERLQKEVLKLVPNAQVFIPCHTYKKNGKTINKSLMEGYIFATQTDPLNFFKLENTNYFKQILSSMSSDKKKRRIPNRIRDSEIEKMRSKLAAMYEIAIREQDTIIIKDGLYKDLEAVVLEVRQDSVLCRVALRSLESILELPKLFVEKA